MLPEKAEALNHMAENRGASLVRAPAELRFRFRRQFREVEVHPFQEPKPEVDLETSRKRYF